MLFYEGAFTVSIAKKTGPRRIDRSEGYLPQCSGHSRLETNVTFLLKKGNGPQAWY